MDVIDLHCDLLAYLAMSPERDPYHPSVRCSLPQLEAGNVKTQVLAISSETCIYSLNFCMRQMEIFLELQSGTRFIPAFENASSFSIENESLVIVLNRLERILTKLTPLYISLTWNGENRFGGGCGSETGLKSDGKELLRFLSKRGVHIDFSHTSDHLAKDLFHFIDKENLDIPVMASHSNFRTIVNHPRNLSDEIAKEIIARGGLIGLVFYNIFLGHPSKLIQMIEHGLELGGEKNLAFGADFFCLDESPSFLIPGGGFFEEMSNASMYPSILKNLEELGEPLLKAIAQENAERVIQKSVYSSR